MSGKPRQQEPFAFTPLRFLADRWYWAALGLTSVTIALVVLKTGLAGVLLWFDDNHEAFSGIQSVVQTVFFIAAGVLAYDRFFRGRGAICRAELELSVKVVEAPPSGQLHIIEFRFRNVGTISIWAPAPQLRLRHIGPDSAPVNSAWRSVEVCESSPRTNDVVDSGETVAFCTFAKIPSEYWAVEYEAIVQDRNGILWMAKLIAANKE